MEAGEEQRRDRAEPFRSPQQKRARESRIDYRGPLSGYEQPPSGRALGRFCREDATPERFVDNKLS